jgi:hypothetical protein
MIAKYILDGKMAVRCDSLMDWALWMESNNQHVADDMICDIRISTIFLGLDHNHSRRGDPLLFETMVFLPDRTAASQVRYFTYGEAEAGHKELVEAVKEQIAVTDRIALDVLRGIMAKRIMTKTEGEKE